MKRQLEKKARPCPRSDANRTQRIVAPGAEGAEGTGNGYPAGVRHPKTDEGHHRQGDEAGEAFRVLSPVRRDLLQSVCQFTRFILFPFSPRELPAPGSPCREGWDWRTGPGPRFRSGNVPTGRCPLERKVLFSRIIIEFPAINREMSFPLKNEAFSTYIRHFFRNTALSHPSGRDYPLWEDTAPLRDRRKTLGTKTA